MKNFLVIKTGASGDVVRTTILLRILSGNIYWITDPYNFPIFPDSFPGLHLISSKEIQPLIFDLDFEFVLNLEEDLILSRLLSAVKTKRWIGAYASGNTLQYCKASAPWFEMGLISLYGKQEANQRKLANTRSFQEHLCNMLGHRFKGEEYCIHQIRTTTVRDDLVAIEPNAGKRWPNKTWVGYENLTTALKKEGYTVHTLKRRASLREYMVDIQRAFFLFTGDTLAMHLALAYKVPCIAIFNCTSPAEIYDYNRMKKVISPLLTNFYYHNSFSPEAVSAVSVEEVYTAFNDLRRTLKMLE